MKNIITHFIINIEAFSILGCFHEELIQKMNNKTENTIQISIPKESILLMSPMRLTKNNFSTQ